MSEGAADLQSAETPGDAIRALSGHGPQWDAAIELGIDVSLLERNLRLSPVERIRQLDRWLAFQARVQARTVSPETRTALARERLREKLAALGPELDDASKRP